MFCSRTAPVAFLLAGVLALSAGFNGRVPCPMQRAVTAETTMAGMDCGAAMPMPRKAPASCCDMSSCSQCVQAIGDVLAVRPTRQGQPSAIVLSHQQVLIEAIARALERPPKQA